MKSKPSDNFLFLEGLTIAWAQRENEAATAAWVSDDTGNPGI